MRLLTWGLTASGGGARPLHTSVPVGEQAGDEQAGGEQAGRAPSDKTSGYRGVCWVMRDTVWEAYLRDLVTKRQQHIGCYTTEEDAARAYDHALVELRGPECTERNFPGELISEPPVSLGDERRESKTSIFHGVYWNREASAWHAQLWNPYTKHRQHIGYYDYEEVAARAYDRGLVKLRGPGCIQRNFPEETISEPSAARRRKRLTSRSLSL
ncbi:hypothetical protein FOA52_003436 [Chlamydomonas sp. UWO 241]|nr:hypothetical protein FOA52_003436 [Chlamydomonas sp. UWO 241]